MPTLCGMATGQVATDGSKTEAEEAALIVVCSECGQENRVPAARAAERAKCGACKARLGPVSTPLDVGPSEFTEIVEGARVPILVDFWAAWCGPCRMAAPEVKRVAHDLAGRALVLKVDTDRHAELASRFQVRGIPHFVVLKDRAIVRQQSGLVDHRQLRQWLEQAAA